MDDGRWMEAVGRSTLSRAQSITSFAYMKSDWARDNEVQVVTGAADG